MCSVLLEASLPAPVVQDFGNWGGGGGGGGGGGPGNCTNMRGIRSYMIFPPLYEVWGSPKRCVF